MTFTRTPFAVSVSEPAIADLRARLGRTRWPDQLPDAGWEYGTDLSVVAEICEYWRSDYDWRGFEARSNAFPQYIATVGGHRLHWIHARSPHPGAVPVLLLHGWPGSGAEYFDVIAPLVDSPAGAFDVIVPSLPGYGWSGPTVRRGVEIADIARCLLELMDGLGYGRFVVHGGDWGAIAGTYMAEIAPERVRGLHLSLILGPRPRGAKPADLDPEDVALAQAAEDFHHADAGYRAIQRTRPQTLAYALQDSPSGLAAWILDKFSAWSGGGDPRARFPVDRLIDNLSVYWLSNTIGSSMRLYREVAESNLTRRPRVTVPTSYAEFPDEPFRAPRAWAEACYPIQRWTRMPRGGHFPAMEVPDLLVGSLRATLRDTGLAAPPTT
jgi:pimeloyl-ACP methyl ester carboxylesterase